MLLFYVTLTHAGRRHSPYLFQSSSSSSETLRQFAVCLLIAQVEVADRAPPSLTTRRSPSTVVSLSGGRHGVFITSAHLAASDRDSPAEQLQFSVTAAPRFGHLENHRTGESVCVCVWEGAGWGVTV